MNSSTLEPVDTGIWQARHALVVNGVPAHTRMTVVLLPHGELWVHSPIPLNTRLAVQLRSLGTVGTVVAPNRAHHLFAKDFMRSFPEATLLLAPGLERKRPDLAGQSLPCESDRWMPQLHYHLFGGIPVMSETVWFHAPSGTLILTDLCQWWAGDDLPLRARLWASLTRVRRGLAVPIHVRAMVRDRTAAAASARHLLGWPVRRVSVAHDALVEQDAAERLARALAPLARQD